MISRICVAPPATSIVAASAPIAPGSVIIRPLGTILARVGAAGAEVLHQDVVVRLEHASPDDQRVAALEERTCDGGDVEDVSVGWRRSYTGVIEHEVEWPTDVRVGVAQTGNHGGAGQVDDTGRGGIDVGAAEDTRTIRPPR